MFQMILNFKNFLKSFQSFFGWGVTKGQFFFQFFAVSRHSESILNFSNFLQNRSDRGGGAGDQKSLFVILPDSEFFAK